MKSILTAAWLVTLAATASAAPLNIVIILGDDIGYGDFGCYGSNETSPPLPAMGKRDSPPGWIWRCDSASIPPALPNTLPISLSFCRSMLALLHLRRAKNLQHKDQCDRILHRDQVSRFPELRKIEKRKAQTRKDKAPAPR